MIRKVLSTASILGVAALVACGDSVSGVVRDAGHLLSDAGQVIVDVGDAIDSGFGSGNGAWDTGGDRDSGSRRDTGGGTIRDAQAQPEGPTRYNCDRVEVQTTSETYLLRWRFAVLDTALADVGRWVSGPQAGSTEFDTGTTWATRTSGFGAQQLSDGTVVLSCGIEQVVNGELVTPYTGPQYFDVWTN